MENQENGSTNEPIIETFKMNVLAIKTGENQIRVSAAIDIACSEEVAVGTLASVFEKDPEIMEMFEHAIKMFKTKSVTTQSLNKIVAKA